MMFEAMDELARRDMARRYLEAAELWMRNTIDSQLRAAFGEDYFAAVLPQGEPVIPKKVREQVAARRLKEPERFSRDVDATTFGDCVTLLVHPNHFDLRFARALHSAFPHGRDEVRTFLTRLEVVRNKCAHGGNVSVRELERAICYSNDLIDSLKAFFVSENKQRIYNVPTIVRISDNLGNVLAPRDSNGTLQFYSPDKDELVIGSALLVQAEVDATFDASEYEIVWSLDYSVIAKGPSLRFDVKLEHVTDNLIISCKVISNKQWHRKGRHDDHWQLFYKVLPPID